MDDKFMSDKLELYNGLIFYDRTKNRFFQIRRAFTEGEEIICRCSDFTEYYTSATSVIYQQNLSHDYILKNCEKVIAIDKCDYAKYNGYGWKVKGED